MNLCNRGHESIVYEANSCPLCAHIHVSDKLIEFVQKQYGKIQFDVDENRWRWVEEKPNLE